MKIVFFGGRHVKSVAKKLDENFDLDLIVTTDPQMVKTSVNEKIPYTQVLEIDEKLIGEIKKLKPVIGVVADFGLIIPKKLIDVFPHGILNIHPSLLPKYRGPTPVQTALLNGDTKIGVTIIKIDEKVDHGPILFQEERLINPDDNTPRLLEKLFERSAEILPDVITNYVEEQIPARIQKDSEASLTKQLKKDDGYIDISNPPETELLNRMINALAFWPGVWTKYRLSGSVVIIKFHPGNIIHVEGKKPMSFKDFKNGYEKGEELLRKLGLDGI